MSSSVPGWETICSQAGRQILAAEAWWQGFGSLQPKRHKAQVPLAPRYDSFGFLQHLSQNPPPAALSLEFFSVRNPSHSEKKKKKPIVSKTCLLSARSVYRAPVSSQPSLQTEKPETPREVIFQSTKTGPLEIAVDAKMSHYSPKERITLEALAPRTHIGWSSDGGWTNPSTPPAPPSPPAFGERPPPLLTIGNRGR